MHGPGRFERANAYAEALKKVTGLKPDLVQVFTDADGTAAFYGRYRCNYGADGQATQFKPNHLQDLEMIRTLRFQGADVWPFMLASMDVLPTYRSPHPEWDLEQADGYWTLHVAVFYNTDTLHSRRSAAEQYCQLLRQQGEQACYHHIVSRSSVYIGAFPKSAAREYTRENPLTGVVETRMDVGPAIDALAKRFPLSLHNGHKLNEVLHGRGGKTKRIPAPSFLVVMPKAQRELKRLGGP